MNNFNFYSPTEFVFGKERENECGKYVKKFGGNKVLIHYGSGSVVRSGLLDRVKKSLEKEGIPYVELGGVHPNPRDVLVYEGIDLCKKEGDFWNFYSGKAQIAAAIPVATVLTIAAAGSEGSGDSVITKEEGMWKRGAGSEYTRPKFSILNPELTCTLPAYQTDCGATDIMAHVFERYFTNTTEVEITDRLCEAVLITMVKETPRAITDPNNYQARANIMWSGTVAHNGIVGVGRDQDWNSHGIEHELSGLYDCAHGAGLAVVMPSWMEYVMSHNVMRFAQVATRVFGVPMNFENPEDTAKKGIKAFRQFLKSIGMPINFEELGAKASDITILVEKFGLGEEGRTGGFVALSSEDVKGILEIAATASV